MASSQRLDCEACCPSGGERPWQRWQAALLRRQVQRPRYVSHKSALHSPHCAQVFDDLQVSSSALGEGAHGTVLKGTHCARRGLLV